MKLFLKIDLKILLNLSSYSCESKYKVVLYLNFKYLLSSLKMIIFYGMFFFCGFIVGDIISVFCLKKYL